MKMINYKFMQEITVIITSLNHWFNEKQINEYACYFRNKIKTQAANIMITPKNNWKYSYRVH